MSSTNRGYDRHKSDYYVTPQQPIRDFLSLFLVDEGIDRPDRMSWLDPCAGGDKDNEMSYPSVLQKDVGIDTVDTIDIREDSLADTKENYLDFIPDVKFNFIITNPPFHSALNIIKKALKDVKKGGYVIMLLRLNFWGSQGRRDFFLSTMPKYCYIHSKRISFTTKGGTDSIEYAHFIWQEGTNPTFTKTSII